MYANVVPLPRGTERTVAQRHLEEQVVPAMRSLAGYAGHLVMIDPENGEGIGISLWESEATAQAAAQALTPQRAAGGRLAGQATPLPTRLYEVIASNR